MIRLFLILAVPLLFANCSQHTKKYHEKYYQTILCNELGGEMEYVLEDRTRVDCLTDEYAIEVDFAKKWAESIGQSLYYAYMTKRKPAIGLIIDEDKDQRYIKRIKKLNKQYAIKLFFIKK